MLFTAKVLDYGYASLLTDSAIEGYLKTFSPTGARVNNMAFCNFFRYYFVNLDNGT